MMSISILSLLQPVLIAAALFGLLKYKYPEGNFSLVYRMFLLGILAVLPVYAFDQLIARAGLDSLHSFHRTLFYALVLTGGFYEFLKYVLLRTMVLPSKRVTKTIDVILYSLFIGAGFTTGASLYALLIEPPFINPLLYSLTTSPVFIAVAIIMGYFCGISLHRKYPVIDRMVALLLAVLLQGLYRFCLLLSDTPLLFMAVAGIVIIGGTLLFLALRETTASE
jgi:RsiW-degrading membrane proteinase PrsW (M82 family)